MEGGRGGEKQAGVTGVLEDRDLLEMNEGNRGGQACMRDCMQAGYWPLLKKSIDRGGKFGQLSSLSWLGQDSAFMYVGDALSTGGQQG